MSPALPDLIFMDINMPIMNGIECMAEINKNPLYKNIPVVILSTDVSRAELIFNLGAKAFIKKPSETGKLRLKIEEMVHRDFTVTRKAFKAEC
jgi:CheY-like chemotaxis protein